MPQAEYKACRKCGAPIIGRRAHAIYCSTKCAAAYNVERDRPSHRARRLAALRCNFCERPLETRYQGTKFCNALCRERARYLNSTEEARRRNRATKLRLTYGISVEEYDRMLAAQGGVCAICRDPPGRRHLAVDHCHTTGVIRGLLCSRCNSALGNFRDDTTLLQRAADYLKRSDDLSL